MGNLDNNNRVFQNGKISVPCNCNIKTKRSFCIWLKNLAALIREEVMNFKSKKKLDEPFKQILNRNK